MKSNRFVVAIFLLFSFLAQTSFAIGQAQYVEYVHRAGDFTVANVHDSHVAKIYVDSDDFAGVVRAAGDLQADVKRVTGLFPTIVHDTNNLGAAPIIIGTIGKSRIIDRLINAGIINVTKIRYQWESFITQVVKNPLPGVSRALLIIGSDKRGTIYGIYDLSEEIGVSPWYYWADATPQHQDILCVRPGSYEQGPPSVKYRGIFLNDEYPDLTKWIQFKYGNVSGRFPGAGKWGAANYGEQFYTNLFELILRLKGNYLWPAMWANAFNEDDPKNPVLANEYGIVMGTSHQEPMLRAQQEWDRRHPHDNWNHYVATITNLSNPLRRFWRNGVRRNKNYESIITIGLRGENDSMLLPHGTEAQNIAVLKNIVKVQRNIIEQEINPDPTKVPQLWCPWVESLDYYNKGFRVPDDVTILWTDGGYGNIRRLPTAAERQRSGGAGTYYHIDMHGSARCYQWINTSPIAKIYEQMSLAKKYGADRIWILNVGHFKGYAFPIEYFMNLAWDSKRWRNNNINEYTRLWAAREFGPAHAAEIADLISKYTKYNGRRKPEWLAPNTYSLIDYQEADHVQDEFAALNQRAQAIYNALPASKHDEFYEVVQFPIKASALVNRLYFAAGRNALYAKQGRASANNMAAQVHALFKANNDLMYYFNHIFAHGKWNHFMDQPYIGYTNWHMRGGNNLNAIPITNVFVPSIATMGVAVEESDAVWPGAAGNPALPTFDVFDQQTNCVDVFNKGGMPFQFHATANASWITLGGDTTGNVGPDKRLLVSIDWSQVPSGPDPATGTITVKGANSTVNVTVHAFKPTVVTPESLRGFVESEGRNGYVSIEPEHYTKNISSGANRWIRIEDYGRTLSGMRASQPVDAPSATPGKDSPCLEYRMYLFNPGKVNVFAYLSPTLNFFHDRPLRYAVSFDDQPPQVMTAVPASYDINRHHRVNNLRNWYKVAPDNARIVKSTHTLTNSGYHTLKFWMVDPCVVLQKIVVDLGGVKPSYLGPPESFYAPRLLSIAVAPTNVTLVTNIPDLQFIATGTYSDGSTKDLTAAVTWVVQNQPALPVRVPVATIGSHGLAHTTGISGDQCTILATFGSINGSTTLTVSNGQIHWHWSHLILQPWVVGCFVGGIIVLAAITWKIRTSRHPPDPSPV